MIFVQQDCSFCGELWTWYSQPYIGSIPAGNLLLSAAILFSGALPRKTLKVFSFLRLLAYDPATFFRHQKSLLEPVIFRSWKKEQDMLLSTAQALDHPILAAGDARCD
jgi:solute carrier family 8 (sodium/calcium exchanger)